MRAEPGRQTAEAPEGRVSVIRPRPSLAAAKALLNPAMTSLNLEPAVAAATVCVARAIFNTDNFITRE